MQRIGWTKKLTVLIVLLTQIQVWGAKSKKLKEPSRNPNVIELYSIISILQNAREGDWFVFDLDNSLWKFLFHLGADEGFMAWENHFATTQSTRNAKQGSRALFITVNAAFIRKLRTNPEFKKKMLEVAETGMETAFGQAIENGAFATGLTARQPSYRPITEPYFTEFFNFPFTDFFPDEDSVRLRMPKAFVRPVLAKGVAYSGEKTELDIFQKGEVMLALWNSMPLEKRNRIRRIFVIDDRHENAASMLETAELIRQMTPGQIESITAIEYLGCKENAKSFSMDVARHQLDHWCPDNLILEPNDVVAAKLRARQAAEDARLEKTCDQVLHDKKDHPVDPHVQEQIKHDLNHLNPDHIKTGASSPMRRH